MMLLLEPKLSSAGAIPGTACSFPTSSSIWLKRPGSFSLSTVRERAIDIQQHSVLRSTLKSIALKRLDSSLVAGSLLAPRIKPCNAVLTDALAVEHNLILFDNAGIVRSSSTVSEAVGTIADHIQAFLDTFGTPTC